MYFIYNNAYEANGITNSAYTSALSNNPQILRASPGPKPYPFQV